MDKLSGKKRLNMNNENGMGKEEKQRYTKCKKRLNTNIQKGMGK